MMTPPLCSSTARLLDECWRDAHTRPVRSLSQFAREELVIPEGKHRGEHFRDAVQPWARLLHEAIDSGRWNRVAVTGCVQAGKSLQGYVLPGIYHLFEHVETVVLAAPSMEIAKTKYRNEILPAILANPRFRRYLPERGGGSKGGVPEEILFTNGAHLKFMASHGGDESRSSYTTRVVIATEIDKMDRASSLSREASPVRQIEARASSYDESERATYLECTTSIAEGAIAQEILQGTSSRIVCPCPGCGEWTTPERDCLKGWPGAETVFEARREGCWVCPACGIIWDDADRTAMNRAAKLLHAGEEITRDGTITGQPRETDTLGFRFSAFNNLFWSTATIAAAEWRAARAVDEESAEREACQFRWAVPHEPAEVALTPLSAEDVTRSQSGHKRGIVPPGSLGVTVGIDTGKRRCHWTAIAWTPDTTGHVLDYGEFPVEWQRLGTTQGLLEALSGFCQYAKWQPASGGEPIKPAQVWCDSGWHEHTEAVYQWASRMNAAEKLAPGQERYRPAKGHGQRQRMMTAYSAPKAITRDVRYIGREYHLVRLPKARQLLVHVNADVWKSEVQDRFARAESEPGRLMLFEALAGEHDEYSKHITAERAIEEYKPGRGSLIRLETIRRQNHFLDATYLATAAGDFLTTLLARPRQPKRPPGPPVEPRDDRPFLVSAR